MKKVALFIVTILLLQTTCLANDYPQRFYDVPKEHWAFEQIAELVNRGAINGYEDGSYKPSNIVTRAEWAKIMIKAANKNLGNDAPLFTDMEGHWANPYVNASREYMTSYAGGTEFRPDIAALREDVTVAMVKLKGYSVDNVDFSYISKFKDQDSISANCKKYVAVAVEKGLINGFEDNTFRGQDTLTRAEAAMLLWRAFQKGNDDKVVGNDQTNVSYVQTEAPQKTAVSPNSSKTSEPEMQTSPATNEPTEEPTDEASDDKGDDAQSQKPYILDTVVSAKDVTSIIQDGDCIYYIDGNSVYSYTDGEKAIVTTTEDLLSNAPEAGIEIDAYGTTILPDDQPDECRLLSLVYDYSKHLPFLFVSYRYGTGSSSVGLFEVYLLTDMSEPYIRSDELFKYNSFGVNSESTISCTIDNNAIYYKRYSDISRFDLKTGVSSEWKTKSDYEWIYISNNAFKIGNSVFCDHSDDSFAIFIDFEVKKVGNVQAINYAVANGTLYFFDKNLNLYRVTDLEHERAESVISIDDVDIEDGKEFIAPRRVEKSEMFYDGDSSILFFDKNNKSIRQISKRQ